MIALVSTNKSLLAQLGGALDRRALPRLDLYNSQDALAAVGQQPVAAMIIDARIPTSGGFALAAAMRSQNSTTPTFLITDNRWSAAQRAMARHKTALVDIFAKPICADKVCDAVLEAMAARPPATRASSSDDSEISPQPLALNGDLCQTTFPQLLGRLWRRHATGALFLRQQSKQIVAKKVVYFEGGDPVAVRSNLARESLGSTLARANIISQADCDESMRRARIAPRPQGQILLEMGVISPRQLVVALLQQTRIKLIDVFSWTTGEYRFRDGIELASVAAEQRLDTLCLMAEGVQHRWPRQRIAAELEPLLDHVLVPTGNPPHGSKQLQIAAAEHLLHRAADGGQTLRQLLATPEVPADQAALAAFLLTSSGLLRATRREASPKRP